MEEVKGVSPVMNELTRHPGEIRTLQFTAIDEMGYEPYARELMSFLDTGTLREFMEHLQDNDPHHFD